MSPLAMSGMQFEGIRETIAGACGPGRRRCPVSGPGESPAGEARGTTDSGKKVEFFPNTGYYLPVIYAITGQASRRSTTWRWVHRQGGSLILRAPAAKLWLPYLGETLDNGMAASVAGRDHRGAQVRGAVRAGRAGHLARCGRRRHHARSAAWSSWTARLPASPRSRARPRTWRPLWPSPGRCREVPLCVHGGRSPAGTPSPNSCAKAVSRWAGTPAWCRSAPTSSGTSTPSVSPPGRPWPSAA